MSCVKGTTTDLFKARLLLVNLHVNGHVKGAGLGFRYTCSKVFYRNSSGKDYTIVVSQ